MSIQFVLTVGTDEATLYRQQMPEMPVPQVGDEIFVPSNDFTGKVFGWFKVDEVSWMFPAIRAHTPTMEVDIRVHWALRNGSPAPFYDAEEGWKFPNISDETS